MKSWSLKIEFHYPHNRFALGIDIMRPEKKYTYYTIRLYLLIATLTLDYYIWVITEKELHQDKKVTQ